ncbi:MAG: hypothetical protein JO179_10005, partial [Solirubrobacterales bacterium]|nr:hypothetical protein [Solirubrobacterales bacterium]
MLAIAVTAASLAGWTTASRASIVRPSLGPVQHVEADGLSFGYRTGGSGTPLILVMGRAGTMAEWDPQLIQQLIRNHRVV